MISATGLQDVVAVRGETLTRPLAQRFFVLQQENCFCASWILASLFQAGNQWRSFFIHPRQIDVEGSAGSWRARKPDISGTLLNDSIDRGESQPRTAPLCLRSEERLKHMVPYGIRHPHSRVIYREANVPPKLGVWMEGHIVWPQFGIPCSDRELATVGHSIARICGQVHEDLLDLSTISSG